MLRESLLAAGKKLPFQVAMKPVADFKKEFAGRINLADWRLRNPKNASLNKPLPMLPPKVGDKVIMRSRASKLGLLSSEKFNSMRVIDAVETARARLSAWSALNGLDKGFSRNNARSITAASKSSIANGAEGENTSAVDRQIKKERRSGSYFSSDSAAKAASASYEQATIAAVAYKGNGKMIDVESKTSPDSAKADTAKTVEHGDAKKTNSQESRQQPQTETRGLAARGPVGHSR